MPQTPQANPELPFSEKRVTVNKRKATHLLSAQIQARVEWQRAPLPAASHNTACTGVLGETPSATTVNYKDERGLIGRNETDYFVAVAILVFDARQAG